jgi:CubicO group peptidase (beta-lactamase class C family)
VIIAVIYFSLPYYARQALLHWMPKIDQYHIFNNNVVAAGEPQPWPLSSAFGEYSIPDDLLDDFEKLKTVAFLVIRNDSLLFERYWDDYAIDSHSNSFSMAKSIISLLIGAAIDDGFINGVKQPVHDFLPEFGSFDGTPLLLEDLLTMSAGVKWDEGYSGLFSLTTAAYYGNNLEKLVEGIKQDATPGVQFYYQSGVTQMLSFIIEKATGKRISSYAAEKLWIPMGAEHEALWSLDHKNGHEKAYCCFNSNARDFARLGRLILNKGKWNEKQLISEDYIERATTPASHLLAKDGKSRNMQYGYQFWILEHEGMLIPYLRGILGQYVFAIPEQNAVIVRLGKKRSDTRHSLPYDYTDDIDIWLKAGLSIIYANK